MTKLSEGQTDEFGWHGSNYAESGKTCMIRRHGLPAILLNSRRRTWSFPVDEVKWPAMKASRYLWLRLLLVGTLAAGPWQVVMSAAATPAQPTAACHDLESAETSGDRHSCCETGSHHCAGGYLCQAGTAVFSPHSDWALVVSDTGRYDELGTVAADAPDRAPLVPPPTA
ncbi:MAG: hypothetical protein LJE84_08905 [Gammaproteobacteria bacterium]|nr:hypothetical protein [Gammaproteobacteria bacterium]